MQRLHRGLICVGTLAVLLGLATGAQAEMLAWNLNYSFSGGSPSGSPPWLTVTLDDSADSVGANGVRLTLSAVGLATGEFVRNLYLNFDPALNAAALHATAVQTSAISNTWTLAAGNDAHKADGDGWYDLFFDLPTAGAKRLTRGESVAWDLTYTAPICVASFDFLSVKSAQGFPTMAHVQGIVGGEYPSGWITVGDPPVDAPEPATLSLLAGGLGMLAVGGVFHRRRRQLVG